MLKYGIDFRQSTLYLDKQKHPRIYMFRINFANLEGNNLFDLDDRVEGAKDMEADADSG